VKAKQFFNKKTFKKVTSKLKLTLKISNSLVIGIIFYQLNTQKIYIRKWKQFIVIAKEGHNLKQRHAKTYVIRSPIGETIRFIRKLLCIVRKRDNRNAKIMASYRYKGLIVMAFQNFKFLKEEKLSVVQFEKIKNVSLFRRYNTRRIALGIFHHIPYLPANDIRNCILRYKILFSNVSFNGLLKETGYLGCSSPVLLNSFC